MKAAENVPEPFGGPEQCVRETCNRRREGLLFCDRHRRELHNLIASIPDVPIRPRKSCQALRSCLIALRNFDLGAVTDHELNCMLLDALLVGGESPANCWEQCFEAIPVPLLRGLLAACPTARMFSPPRYSEPDFIALKGKFARQLSQWLSQHASPPPKEPG